MKTKAKKLVTLILTALLVLSILPMNVFAAPIGAGSTASIKIENAVENDVLAAYKVVDIAYNAATNTLSYAWNSNFADYFAGTKNIYIQANKSLVTLSTCHPYPYNYQRYLVYAELVEN